MTQSKQTHGKQNQLTIRDHLQSLTGAAILGLFLSAAVLAPAFAAEDKASLKINVNGLEAQTGQVLIALFDSADGFEANTPLRDAAVDVEAADITISFSDLALGRYAFKLFHDVNGNGELDTDMLGIPSEPYSFSQDASDPFSAPEWDESKFSLRGGETVQTIMLDN